MLIVTSPGHKKLRFVVGLLGDCSGLLESWLYPKK